MESMCTIPFDVADVASQWQVELGHLEWSAEEYNFRLSHFCPCTLPNDGDDTLRQCSEAEKAVEQAYRDQVRPDNHLLLCQSFSRAKLKSPCVEQLGGEASEEALDKERCASLALAPLPLTFSYKSEKSLRGTGGGERSRFSSPMSFCSRPSIIC